MDAVLASINHWSMLESIQCAIYMMQEHVILHVGDPMLASGLPITHEGRKTLRLLLIIVSELCALKRSGIGMLLLDSQWVAVI